MSLVFCLFIDMIDSTKTWIDYPSKRLARINKAFVEQINPHLEKLELSKKEKVFPGVLLKFTGDGWLLMTDDSEKCLPLCCLAIIMANNFHAEMREKTGIKDIPPLRLAICSGLDISVELPDGRKDWAGDSARKASRASGDCLPNQILVDGTVHSNFFRDFIIKPEDVKKHPPEYQSKKREQNLPLYCLEGVNPEAAEGSDAPEYLVYTLDIIGKREEAEAVAQQVEEHLISEAKKLPPTENEKQQNILRGWTRLIVNVPDYSSALKMLKDGRAFGLLPNEFTYTALISKAPEYDDAKAWVDKMREEGFQPNVFTYSTLFSKDLSEKSADDILKWYLAQEYHPELPIQAAIAAYRKIRRIDHALRLALDYPHLQAARKLIRKHEGEALSYFKTFYGHDPQHPNAAYALGVALMELGKEREAQPYLKKALKLATAGPRKVVIKEWLRQIEQKLSLKNQ
ncbi:MAG: hypothetical protein ACUZ77_08670 [Candidatus Brocadiales bacterium]